MLTNPTDPIGLRLTNVYAHARNLPPANVLWIDPGAADLDELIDVKQAGMFGELVNRRLTPSVDYILLGPGTGYEVPAPGLLNDPCPVAQSTISLPGAYTFAKFADSLRTTTLSSLLRNGYYTAADSSVAFDAEETYEVGQPGGGALAGNLFIGASLAYTGVRGVSASNTITMIDRSLAAGPGTASDAFYFMRTTDSARSGPRQGLFDTAATRIGNAGFSAEVVAGQTLPTNATGEALGVMTGDDVLSFESDVTPLAAGSFAEHLTSFGADFNRSQQTKISEWIRQGASGSFGTVEEPCAISDKFPAAYMHVHYANGLTLGEAVLRSLRAVPFQGYLMGDPLTRPFASGPTVSVQTALPSPVRGQLIVNPTVAATRPGTSVGTVTALVDGVVVAEGSAGETLLIPTLHLDDGWHDLRIVATDDSPQAVTGEWVGSFVLSNAGKAATVSASTLSPDRTSTVSFEVDGLGGVVVERRVVHLGRVIAAAGPSGPLVTRGEIIGGGPARVWAEVDFQDGTTARSEPLLFDARNARPTPTITPVVAYSYTKRTAPGEAFLVELPADFADDASVPTYQIVTQPAQATLLGGDGPVRVFRADANASGTDTLVYSITNGATTDTATVTIRYREVPVPCLADVNRDGVASDSDFFTWVTAYLADDPTSDQNGDGQFGTSSLTGDSDFFAWVTNFLEGCRF
ncbi:MAG: hypothetical protein AAGB48_01315 [Planctomycetota bacterium]